MEDVSGIKHVTEAWRNKMLKKRNQHKRHMEYDKVF